MKIHYLFLLLLLSGCSSTQRATKTYGEALFQHWTHSYEEDAGGQKVYRPAGYDFPPSRGREGFEIRPDGVYIRYAIGRADYPEQMKGSWKMKGTDSIVVDLPSTPVFELKIISVEKDRLIVRQ